MKAYRILVHDLREREPVVLAAELAHDARAHEFARDRLSSSAHLAAIEVWRGSVKLCHLVKPEYRAAA
jgi:hypothetical protein